MIGEDTEHITPTHNPGGLWSCGLGLVVYIRFLDGL